MTRGAIILCGGRSSRMGRDKALLPVGPGEVMLQRIVRLVSEAVASERIVCVAAPGQELPRLPSSVRAVFDPASHQGPLAGLASGLAALRHTADAAFVTACDAPLLVPALVERMFDLLGNHDIAAIHDGQHWHPLVATYRTNLLSQVNSLLSHDERSLAALLESANTRRVLSQDVRDIDPDFFSLIACNTPHDYQTALRQIGRSG